MSQIFYILLKVGRFEMTKFAYYCEYAFAKGLLNFGKG